MKMAFFLILLTAASLLGGCSKMTSATVKHNDGSYLDQGRVQFESSSSRYLVEVERVDPLRLENGLLKVVLTLRNKTKDNLWTDIRTTFLDEQGHVLEETNKEPFMLEARTVSEYTCTSLGGDAADYRIIIYKPKKSALMP